MSDSAVNVSSLLGVVPANQKVKEGENEEEEKPKLKPLFTYADQMPIDTLLPSA